MSYNKKVVIILGAPRSGTTLLRFLLGQHPQLSDLPETPWLTGGYANASLRQLHEALINEKYGPCKLLGLAESDVDRLICDLSDGLFMEIGKELGKDESLVIKTPDDADNPEYLAMLFPNAQYIHIIRDGRDVALSTIEKFAKGTDKRMFPGGYGEINFYNSLNRWVSFEKKIEDFLAQQPSDKCHHVTYEDLARAPEQQMNSIFEYLGLVHFDSAKYYERDKSKLPAFEAGSCDVNARQNVDVNSVGRWEMLMSNSVCEYIDQEFGDFLLERGYELSCSRVVDRKTVKSPLYQRRVSSLFRGNVMSETRLNFSNIIRLPLRIFRPIVFIIRRELSKSSLRDST